jgi:hypothetical protein
MNASNYLEMSALNHFFRGIETPPSECFLHLYISNPTDADIGTAVNGASYMPQRITFGNPQIIDGKTSIANDTEIRFIGITENWGNISHFGIRDAQNGGNLLAHAPVDIPREIFAGDESIWGIGSIRISLN